MKSLDASNRTSFFRVMKDKNPQDVYLVPYARKEFAIAITEYFNARHFELQHVLEKNDLVIIVEHCAHCDSHAHILRHHEHKYRDEANRILRALAEAIHDMDLPIRLGVVRFPVKSELRMGIFDVSAIYCDSQGQFISSSIHSKLESKKWPTKKSVMASLRSFISTAKIPSDDRPNADKYLSTVSSVGLAPYPVGKGPLDATVMGDGSWSYPSLNHLEISAVSSKDVQWIFDSRIPATVAPVFDVGRVVWVSGVTSLSGGVERHSLLGTIVHNPQTLDQIVSVRLKHHAEAISVHLSNIIADSEHIPRRFHLNESGVPLDLEVFVVLSEMLADALTPVPISLDSNNATAMTNSSSAGGKNRWCLFHEGDIEVEGRLYLTPYSFFHQARHLVNGIEHAMIADRKIPYSKNSRLKHKSTGRVVDLQLVYCEEMLDFIFDKYGQPVDITSLQEQILTTYRQVVDESLSKNDFGSLVTSSPMNSQSVVASSSSSSSSAVTVPPESVVPSGDTVVAASAAVDGDGAGVVEPSVTNVKIESAVVALSVDDLERIRYVLRQQIQADSDPGRLSSFSKEVLSIGGIKSSSDVNQSCSLLTEAFKSCLVEYRVSSVLSLNDFQSLISHFTRAKSSRGGGDSDGGGGGSDDNLVIVDGFAFLKWLHHGGDGVSGWSDPMEVTQFIDNVSSLALLKASNGADQDAEGARDSQCNSQATSPSKRGARSRRGGDEEYDEYAHDNEWDDDCSVVVGGGGDVSVSHQQEDASVQRREPQDGYDDASFCTNASALAADQADQQVEHSDAAPPAATTHIVHHGIDEEYANYLDSLSVNGSDKDGGEYEQDWNLPSPSKSSQKQDPDLGADERVSRVPQDESPQKEDYSFDIDPSLVDYGAVDSASSAGGDVCESAVARGLDWNIPPVETGSKPLAARIPKVLDILTIETRPLSSLSGGGGGGGSLSAKGSPTDGFVSGGGIKRRVQSAGVRAASASSRAASPPKRVFSKELIITDIELEGSALAQCPLQSGKKMLVSLSVDDFLLSGPALMVSPTVITCSLQGVEEKGGGGQSLDPHAISTITLSMMAASDDPSDSSKRPLWGSVPLSTGRLRSVMSPTFKIDFIVYPKLNLEVASSDCEGNKMRLTMSGVSKDTKDAKFQNWSQQHTPHFALSLRSPTNWKGKVGPAASNDLIPPGHVHPDKHFWNPAALNHRSPTAGSLYSFGHEITMRQETASLSGAIAGAMASVSPPHTRKAWSKLVDEPTNMNRAPSSDGNRPGSRLGSGKPSSRHGQRDDNSSAETSKRPPVPRFPFTRPVTVAQLIEMMEVKTAPPPNRPPVPRASELQPIPKPATFFEKPFYTHNRFPTNNSGVQSRLSTALPRWPEFKQGRELAKPRSIPIGLSIRDSPSYYKMY